jgi:hypothetical protein
MGINPALRNQQNLTLALMPLLRASSPRLHRYVVTAPGVSISPLHLSAPMVCKSVRGFYFFIGQEIGIRPQAFGVVVALPFFPVPTVLPKIDIHGLAIDKGPTGIAREERQTSLKGGGQSPIVRLIIYKTHEAPANLMNPIIPGQTGIHDSTKALDLLVGE